MSIHNVVKKEGIYFITFTCCQWLHLIERSQGYDLVYNFFTALRNQLHTMLGYVIMPNHLHFLLHYNGGKSLNTVIGNGKRFMAYEIVNRLEERGESRLLDRLCALVTANDRDRGKKHEVWIDSFDAKECWTEKFILQKLTYMHENPVRGKWKLCNTPLDYLHSSAPFYYNGRQQLFPVKDYRDFINWRSTSE